MCALSWTGRATPLCDGQALSQDAWPLPRGAGVPGGVLGSMLLLCPLGGACLSEDSSCCELQQHRSHCSQTGILTYWQSPESTRS